MSNKKPKFKFGDRVEYDDVEFTIIQHDSSDNSYSLSSDFDFNSSAGNWVDEQDLTLLPKTRNEILKDMIDGAEYKHGSNFIRFQNGGFQFKGLDTDHYWEKRQIGDICCEETFSQFKRIEQPETKLMTEWNIFNTEITEEQAKKIKEVIEGVA
jgi:hypothetical protein